MSEKEKREYHFVVRYDADADEFDMDYDTLMAKFHDSPIYNPETGEWERLKENHWEDENSNYNNAGDAIWDAVKSMKLRGKND
jgi:hypothetical protein